MVWWGRHADLHLLHPEELLSPPLPQLPLQNENVCPISRAVLASAGSQWPLVQSNPYAKKANLGVT